MRKVATANIQRDKHAKAEEGRMAQRQTSLPKTKARITFATLTANKQLYPKCKQKIPIALRVSMSS